MALKLVYTREHACHNKPMIWQPAGHHFYCAVCHRKEAPGEYVSPKPDVHDSRTAVESEQPDQPIPA